MGPHHNLLDKNADQAISKTVLQKQQNTQHLNIFHLNMRSLNNKRNSLKILLDSIESPDVVCLSEIWLEEADLLHYVVSGYKLVSYYCRSSDKGGGVAYIYKSIH